jgi:hypothetical protein
MFLPYLRGAGSFLLGAIQGTVNSTANEVAGDEGEEDTFHYWAVV